MKKRIQITQLLVLTISAMMLASCASLYIKNGKEAYNDLKYHDAIYYLNKGVAKKQDPDAVRKLGESYLKVNNFEKAATTYEQIATFTDNSDADRINQARALMGIEKYSEAKPILEGIISRDANNQVAKELLQSCKTVDRMKSDSLLYLVEPVNIPSSEAVFSPFPFNGGLIFSSPSGKGENDPYTDKTYTNLFYSKKEGASWTTPEALEGVNGNFHDAVAAVSPSGQTIVFTRSFQLNGGALAGNDQRVSMTQLYTSKIGADGKWEKPTLVPFCDSKYMFAHPAFSPDGKTMYFSSDMPGGFGEMDIWEAQLTDNSWGTPKNLGGDINSKGNEVFPTVKDENTLFFSSDTHESLGGLDILQSTRKNGIWENPVHISYPINTSTDDFGMAWNADGKSGFFTSDRYGSDKIYSFTFDDTRVTLNGLVTGKDSMLPLGGVRVTIKNLTDGTEQMVITDGDGKFTADLIKGKDYQMVADLEGYFKQTEGINTKTGENPISKVIEMSEVYITDTTGSGNNGNNNGNNGGNNGGETPGMTNANGKKYFGIYDISDIHWDYNKWDIRQDALPYLDNLAKVFRENPDLKFELRSHTDCRGSFEYNDDLSSKRAKAAVDYLVKKGVPRAIIVSKGYGERELLNECSDGVYCDEAKHEQNRRTEFIVTGKKK
jgi:outer membrane protein OmpA-like peptidoglycan-associated protein